MTNLNPRGDDPNPGPGEIFCPSCGSITRGTADFCSGCGVRISANLQRFAHAAQSEFGTQSQSSIESQPESTGDHELRSLPILLLLLLVVAGAATAIPGAFQGEIFSGILGPWLWAPVVEEILKPSGIYLLVLKWPGSITSRFRTASYGALAGVAFGLIESLIYVTIYFSDPTQQEIVLRFTLPVFMHGVASFVFALGITRQLPQRLATRGSLPASSWGFFVAAIVLHSTYNVVVGFFWPF